VTHNPSNDQVSETTPSSKASIRTRHPLHPIKSMVPETKYDLTQQTAGHIYDVLPISPQDLCTLLSPMASPGVLPDWAAARFQVLCTKWKNLTVSLFLWNKTWNQNWPWRE
ncbi:hypothetical protein XENOCAPTIV_013626, partial [Xenoophorus captivus]